MKVSISSTKIATDDSNMNEFIQIKLNEIIESLKKENIDKDNGFISWLADFERVYSLKKDKLFHFATSALLYYFGQFLLFDGILEVEISNSLTKTEYLEFNKEIKQELIHFGYSEIIYFKIFEKTNEKCFLAMMELVFFLFTHLEQLSLNTEYYLDYLVHELISPLTRHESGEFYTPPFLVDLMVNNSYMFGDAVLDPCCGSGNFLIAIIKVILESDHPNNKKREAISKLYGFDINPISIYITKVNFILLLHTEFPRIKLNLHVMDSLFENLKEEKFDLVISNPPWYTYRDIAEPGYQEAIKSLAEELGIKPAPKNILNIEMAALFFYHSREQFLMEGGRIFFVMTKGVFTGSHASKFRRFTKFNNLEAWSFDYNVEKIFNIDFICLMAQKDSTIDHHQTIEIMNRHFSLPSNQQKLEYFDPVKLVQSETYALVPYSIIGKEKNQKVKKLVRKERIQELVPNRESIYKKLFHKGADLNPRNLIFIISESVNDGIVKINPDERVFKRAKSTWKERIHEDTLVEKKYLFKVVKSTELVKFKVYDDYDVFLPLSQDALLFDPESLEPNAARFWNKINEYYITHKKKTTKNKSLMDNLNRWNKLCNERQGSTIKIAYNNSGSVLNAAVIKGNYLVTGDLSFHAVENLDEAYYLSAILNSPFMTKQIKIRKSSRHIFKIPWEMPIKKFDPSSAIHGQLAELGEKGENLTASHLTTLKNNGKITHSKMSIQNQLKRILTPLLDKVDKLVERELLPKSN